MIDETKHTPSSTQTDITSASLTRLMAPIALKSNRENDQEVTIADMCHLLENALHHDGEGKELLFEQAQTLNAIFTAVFFLFYFLRP